MQVARDESPAKSDKSMKSESQQSMEGEKLLSDQLSIDEKKFAITGEEYAISELYAHIPQKNLKTLIQPVLKKKKFPKTYKHQQRQETLKLRQGLYTMEKGMLRQEIIEDAMDKWKEHKAQVYFRDKDEIPDIAVLGIQQHQGRARTMLTTLRDKLANLESTRNINQDRFLDSMTKHLKKLKEHSIDNSYVMIAVLLTQVSREDESVTYSDDELPADFYSKTIHAILHRLELPTVKVLQRSKEAIWCQQTLYIKLQCIEIAEQETSIWPHVGQCETCRKDLGDPHQHYIQATKRIPEISTTEQNDYKIELLMDLHDNYRIDRAVQETQYIPNKLDGHVQFPKEKVTVTLNKMDLLNSIRKAHEVFKHKRGGVIIAFSKKIDEQISQAQRNILKKNQECYNPAMVYLSSELIYKEEYKQMDEEKRISKETEPTPLIEETDYTINLLYDLMEEYQVKKEEMDFFIDGTGIQNLEDAKFRLLITNIMEALELHGKNIYIIDGLTNIMITSSCLTKKPDPATLNLSYQASDCDHIHVDITKNSSPLYSLSDNVQWHDFTKTTEELARELINELVTKQEQMVGIFSDREIEDRKQKQLDNKQTRINQAILSGIHKRKAEQAAQQEGHRVEERQKHIEQLYEEQQPVTTSSLPKEDLPPPKNRQKERQQKIEQQIHQRLEQGSQPQRERIKSMQQDKSIGQQKQKQTTQSIDVQTMYTQKTMATMQGKTEAQTIPQSPLITETLTHGSAMFGSPQMTKEDERQSKEEEQKAMQDIKEAKEGEEDDHYMIFTNQKIGNVDYMISSDPSIREILEGYYEQYQQMQLHRFKLKDAYIQDMEKLKKEAPEAYEKKVIQNRQERVAWAINLPEEQWQARAMMLRLPDQLQEIWYWVNCPDSQQEDKVEKCSPEEGDIQLNQNLKELAAELTMAKQTAITPNQNKSANDWHREQIAALASKMANRQKEFEMLKKSPQGTDTATGTTNKVSTGNTANSATKESQQKKLSHQPKTLQQVIEELKKQHSHPGGIPLLNHKPGKTGGRHGNVHLQELTFPTLYDFKQPQIQEPNQRAGWHLLNPHRPEEYQIDEEGRPTESATNMYNKFRERQLNRTAQIYGLKREEMVQQDAEFSKLIKHVLTNTSKYGASETFQQLYEEGERQYDLIMKEMEVDHLIPLTSCASTQAIYILAGHKELTKKIQEGIGYEGNIGNVLDPTNNHITVRTYIDNDETEVFDWEIKTKEEKQREDQLEEQAIMLARQDYERRQRELLAMGYDPTNTHPEDHRIMEEENQQDLHVPAPILEPKSGDDTEQKAFQEKESKRASGITSSSKSIAKNASKKSGQQKTIVQITAEKRQIKKKEARKKQKDQQLEGQEAGVQPKKQAGGKRMAMIANTGTRADQEASNRLRLALKGEIDFSPEQLKEYLKTLLWNFLKSREIFDLHNQHMQNKLLILKEIQDPNQREPLERQVLYHKQQTEISKKELANAKRQIIKLRKQAEYERVEEQLAAMFEKAKIWPARQKPREKEDSKVEDNKVEDNKAEDSKVEDNKMEDSKAEDNRAEDSKAEDSRAKENVKDDRKIQDNQGSDFSLPIVGKIQDKQNSSFQLPNNLNENNKQGVADKEEHKESQLSLQSKIQIISDNTQQSEKEASKDKKEKNRSETSPVEQNVAGEPGTGAEIGNQQQTMEEKPNSGEAKTETEQQSKGQDDQGKGGLYDHGNLHLPPAEPLAIDQPTVTEDNAGNDFQLKKKRLYHDPPNEEEQEALNDEAEIQRFRRNVQIKEKRAQLRLQLQRDIEAITRKRCKEFGRKRAKELRERMLNKAIQHLDWAERIEEETGDIVTLEPEIKEIIAKVENGELDPNNLDSDDSSSDDNVDMAQERAANSRKKATICHYCECIITTEERNGIDAETGQSDPKIICCTICLNKVRREIDQRKSDHLEEEENSEQQQERKLRKTCKKCNRYLEVMPMGNELKTFCKKCDVINDSELESIDNQTRASNTVRASQAKNPGTVDQSRMVDNDSMVDDAQSSMQNERGEAIMLTEDDDPRLKQNQTKRAQEEEGLEEYGKLTNVYTGVTMQFQIGETIFDCTRCETDILNCPCAANIADSHFIRSLHQTQKTRMRREKQLQRQNPATQEEKHLYKLQKKTGYRVLDTYYRMQQNRGTGQLALNPYQRDLKKACARVLNGKPIYGTDGQFDVSQMVDVYPKLASLKKAELEDKSPYRMIPKYEWLRDLEDLLRENREAEAEKDKQILQEDDKMTLGETGYSVLGSTQRLHRVAVRAIQIWEGILNCADDQTLIDTANTIIQDVAAKTVNKQSINQDDVLYRSWKIYERLLKKAQSLTPTFKYLLGEQQPNSTHPPDKEYQELLDYTMIVQSHKSAVGTLSQKPKSTLPPSYKLFGKCKLLSNLVPQTSHFPTSHNTQQHSSAFTQTQAIHAYQMELKNDCLVATKSEKKSAMNILEIMEIGMGIQRGARRPEIMAGVKMIVQRGEEENSEAQTTEIVQKTFNRIQQCQPILEAEMMELTENEQERSFTSTSQRQQDSQLIREMVRQYIADSELQITPLRGILRCQSNLDQITDLISLAVIPQAIPIVTSLIEKEQNNAIHTSDDNMPKAYRMFYSLMNTNLPKESSAEEEKKINGILARLAKVDIAMTEGDNRLMTALMTSRQAFNDRYTCQEWRASFTQIKWTAFSTYLSDIDQPNHAYRKPLYIMPKHFNGHSVFDSFTIDNPTALQTLVPGMEWIDAINVAVGRIVFHTIEDALRCHYRNMDMLKAAIALHASKGPIFFSNPCIFVKEGKYLGRVAFSVHMTTYGTTLEKAQNDIRYLMLILNALPTTRVIGEITYKYGAAKPYLTIAYPFIYTRQKQWQTKLAFLDGLQDLITNQETCQYILQDALRIKWYVMHWQNDHGTNDQDTRKKSSYLQVAWHHHCNLNPLSDTPINNLDLYEKFFRPDKSRENPDKFAAGSKVERQQLLYAHLRDDRTHFHGKKTKFQERFDTMQQYTREMYNQPQQQKACYKEVDTETVTKLLEEYDTENVEHAYLQALHLHEKMTEQRNNNIPQSMQDYIETQKQIPTAEQSMLLKESMKKMQRQWQEEDMDFLAKLKEQAHSQIGHQVNPKQDDDADMQQM